MAKEEIAAVVPSDIEPSYAQPGTKFSELTQDAVSLPGFELADDELLDALVGVELIITRVTVRVGDISRRPDNVWLKEFPKNTKSGYVSLELTVTDNLNLQKINRARASNKMSQLASLEALGIDAEDNFVINDGSTGIYRQILAFLGLEQYIVLPDGELDGKAGTTVLDTIPSEWQEVNVGESLFDKAGNLTYTANVRIRCPRGIRRSDYESEFNPDSHTRYLA